MIGRAANMIARSAVLPDTHAVGPSARDAGVSVGDAGPLTERARRVHTGGYVMERRFFLKALFGVAAVAAAPALLHVDEARAETAPVTAAESVAEADLPAEGAKESYWVRRRRVFYRRPVRRVFIYRRPRRVYYYRPRRVYYRRRFFW
jgi:hypothetical protein